ncbi:hypothetical protein JCM11491_004170 [Sporobolomyces phaffii]
MYRPDSRPSTAASSVDLAALSSFPLPPFSGPSPAHPYELRQTSPPWTAYRQTLPEASHHSSSPPPRLGAETPEELSPHSEYFAATSTPQQRQGRRCSTDHVYPTLFEFDEFDPHETPALSSSSYSSRSRTSPFPSPTASSSSSIDSELYNSPGRDKQDVGLGLWLEEQKRMEQAMSELSLSASSTSTTSSAYSSFSYHAEEEEDGERTLPRFDPFGSASPVLVQRASYIKFEQAPALPVQQRLHRPVPIRPLPPHQQTSLLPAANIATSHGRDAPSPFSCRPLYVAPGPELGPSTCTSLVSTSPLSHSDLAQVAALHNGRVPALEQMAPTGQVASNGLPPPIVNTGNQGRMIPQMGDWRCGTCTFVNWRRRKVCMRCFPFASNDIGQSFAAQSQRAAYLASTAMTPSRSAPLFPPSPPSSYSSPPRKMSLPETPQYPFQLARASPSRFSPEAYFAPPSPQYALPPPPPPSSHSHGHFYHAPPFRHQSPCEDAQARRGRRVGGVIGYPGLAF